MKYHIQGIDALPVLWIPLKRIGRSQKVLDDNYQEKSVVFPSDNRRFNQPGRK